MTTIALNLDTADLAESGGAFTEVSGVEEIRQNLWIALNIHQGEIVWDTTFGVPFTAEVMAAGVAPERVAQIFREQILAVAGVTGFIDEPELDFDEVERRWTFTFRVDTDEGALEFTGPIAIEPSQEID